jgi:membrane protein required for colicin V production
MFTGQLAEFFTHTDTMQHVVTQSSSAIGMDTAKPVSYMALGVSFAILFGATVIVGSVIKVLLNLIFTAGVLGFGNRIMGALFGIARGYLICLVIIFLIQLSPLVKQPWWAASKYVPYFQPQVVWLGNKVSPVLSDLKSTFSDQIQDVKGSMDEMTSQIIPDKKPEATSDTDKAPAPMSDKKAPEKMSATTPPATKQE